MDLPSRVYYTKLSLLHVSLGMVHGSYNKVLSEFELMLPGAERGGTDTETDLCRQWLRNKNHTLPRAVNGRLKLGVVAHCVQSQTKRELFEMRDVPGTHTHTTRSLLLTPFQRSS